MNYPHLCNMDCNHHEKPMNTSHPAYLAIATAISFSTASAATTIASFDLGSTTAGVVQTGFTAIGIANPSTNSPGFAGPLSATSGGITLLLTGGGTLAAATTKDGSGNYNSTANITARDRGTPSADSGSFTFSDIYRDFITANFQGIQFSGLTASTTYDLRFYAYDNSGNRTQTFTDVTPGGTGFSGSVTYTAASTFNGSTSNDVFSTLISATSDSQGRLFFTESGAGTSGSSSVALFNAVVVSIPEPSGAALALAAFGILGLRRKRCE